MSISLLINDFETLDVFGITLEKDFETDYEKKHNSPIARIY